MFRGMDGLAGSLGGKITDKEADWRCLRVERINARKKVAGPKNIERFLIDLLVASDPSIDIARQQRQWFAKRIPISAGAGVQQQRCSGKQQNRGPETKIFHASRLLPGKRLIARWKRYKSARETRKITQPENS